MVQLTKIDVRQHFEQRRGRDKDAKNVCLSGGVAIEAMACSKSDE